MTRTAKTVSVSQLQAAVKSALEAARKEHPQVMIDAATPPGGPDIFYRPPLICGFMRPWPEIEYGQLTAYNKSFVSHLASDPKIAALGVDGKFEPAVYLIGGNAALGFVPNEVSITE
jgi:hypothetical protein